MTTVRSLVLALALALAGCTGLEQFPEVSQDYATDLVRLDPAYATALADIYKPGTNADDQMRIRNRLIEGRMAVIDEHFRTFETGLAQESSGADFGIAAAGIGVGAVGSFVAKTASQILSAVSGGLAGVDAAYGKSVLYERAASALLAQMRAERKVIAAQIFLRWTDTIDKYPLWVARTDLEAYYFAGSLPGAIVATSADAKVKDQEADKILQLGAITPECVTKEMDEKRALLDLAIDGLDEKKPTALVAVIASEFPEIKPFLDFQYTDVDRDGDKTGIRAKAVLKSAIELTVCTAEHAGKWQAAIAGL